MCEFLYLTLLSRLSVLRFLKRAEIQSLLLYKGRYEMKFNKIYFSVIFTMILILVSGLSFADEKRYSKKKYEVTITNLTRGQIFSPPIVIAHDSKFSLFTLGEPASDELAALAEDGVTELLAKLIDGKYSYAVAGGPIVPGGSESVTLEISKRSRSRLISVAGMLVTTNDAFFAARDVWFLGKRNIMVEAEAYDAGSERNSEDCDYIPGPPCGSGGSHDPEVAEGYVHVHAGIHGTADLDLNPAEHDWRNPVAKITIERIYH
jgi:hypothetical protein